MSWVELVVYMILQLFFFDLTDRAAVNRGKRGTKLFVPHRNKTRAQQAYVKFITRVDSHPKVLFTDFDEFDHFLMVDKNIPSRFWDIGAKHCPSSPPPLSMSLPRTPSRLPTVSLQTMLFLQLDTTLSGSSRSSIARISVLVSLVSQVFSLAMLPTLTYFVPSFSHLLGHDSDAIDGVDNPTFDDDVEVDLQYSWARWRLKELADWIR